MHLSIFGIVYIALLGVLVPRAAFRSRAILQHGTTVPPRRRIFVGTLLSQLFLATCAVAVARLEWIDLFPPTRFQRGHVLVAAGMLLLAIATIPVRWAARSDADKRRMAAMRPGSAGDLPWWVCVSFAAGVCEEIAYRGVLFQVLDRAIPGWWPAAALSALAFAIAHVLQGWLTVAVVFGFAIMFQWLVALTGDLYAAMAVHFVYDVIAGIVLWRLAKGLPPAADPELPRSDAVAAVLPRPGEESAAPSGSQS